MAERDSLIAAFLDRQGWAGAARSAVSDDASFRSYLRLDDGARRAILMDAPPPKEDVRPFVVVARHLAKLGLSAPEVYAEDPAAGLLLLEDLGDATFTRVLGPGPSAGDQADELYACAIDVLIHIHDRPPETAVPRALPPYDERRLLDEVALLVDWYLPAVTGMEPDDDIRQAFRAVWREPLRRVLAQPKTLVLRDFHVDNLMWLPDRDGVRRCGLLDFQDAVFGSPVYDLMSLLEDARRAVDPVLTAHMLARYLAAFPDLDRDALGAAYAILGAQRHAKVIGVFTRLSHRDGKPQYLKHIPHVWSLLEHALAHPDLGEVRAWIDRALPPERRVQPDPGRPEAAA